MPTYGINWISWNWIQVIYNHVNDHEGEALATSRDVLFRFSNNLTNKHIDPNGILYNSGSQSFLGQRPPIYYLGPLPLPSKNKWARHLFLIYY